MDSVVLIHTLEVLKYLHFNEFHFHKYLTGRKVIEMPYDQCLAFICQSHVKVKMLKYLTKHAPNCAIITICCLTLGWENCFPFRSHKNSLICGSDIKSLNGGFLFHFVHFNNN